MKPLARTRTERRSLLQSQMAPGVSDRIVRLTAEDVEQLMRAVALIITKLSENPNYGRFNTPSVNYAASGYGGGGGRGRGAGGGGPGGDVAVSPVAHLQPKPSTDSSVKPPRE